MPYPEKLKKSLKKHNVDIKTISKIFEDFEGLRDKSPKREKVLFFTQAIKQIDEKFEYSKKCSILDWCACCKGGKREKEIKRLAKEVQGKNLQDKVKALWSVENMGKPILNDDNTISTGIFYRDDKGYKCACSCLHNEEINEPISSTYCLCCAGHFRHHYQKALGIKLKTKKIESSPLESLGKEPCVIIFDIVE
ncbi:hypothetical protein R9X47_20670 [Wukongibacter baidiensis]|uniref:hypothetical protein n=1 Tax=Wukongibacter baidiensis TaxID=1723361 RepID=UPI003D7F82CB